MTERAGKIRLLRLISCIVLMFCAVGVGAGAEELRTGDTLQPQGLKHAGIYDLRELDPTLDGTGVKFDWNIVGHIGKRVFLAGGINPDNAVKAVKLGVYGIDICSGVESQPGKKDHKKMKKLFENIRHLRG